ncbi:hypothetical protein CCACVL1_22712, partial [Corchorus capsularis]
MASHSTSSTDITQINATNHLPLKLNSTNFPSWQLQLDLNGYVDDTHPCPAKSPTTGEGKALKTEIMSSKEVTFSE